MSRPNRLEQKDIFFSRRTNWKLEPNQLISSLEGLRRQDSNILDLTESNPTRCDFKFPKEDILKPLSDDENLKYNPSPRGRGEARDSICQYYFNKGLDVDPKRVFLTSSTSEGYSFLFRLLTNPDDAVIFPRPSYPLFEFLVDLNDVKMDTYSLVYEDKKDRDQSRWQIDLQQLKEAIRPRTRAIVLVNPNNPTGSFVKNEELNSINEMCKEQNLSLICDEVFLDYQMQDSLGMTRSLVSNKEVLTFVMGGLSKCLGLPQMKISWIIVNGPDELVAEAIQRLEIIADTYLSVNTPAQNSLEHWLTLQPKIKEIILKRIQDNYNTLISALNESNNCRCLNFEGGWYVLLNLPDTKTEEQWVLDLLREDNVFVHPGYFFDFKEEPIVVLSLLTKESVFQEGVKRILNRVRQANSTVKI